MNFTITVPPGAADPGLVDGEHVELVKANVLYATVTSPRLGERQIWCDWLVDDAGVPLDQIQAATAP